MWYILIKISLVSVVDSVDNQTRHVYTCDGIASDLHSWSA
jgi:hypothetical protein